MIDGETAASHNNRTKKKKRKALKIESVSCSEVIKT